MQADQEMRWGGIVEKELTAGISFDRQTSFEKSIEKKIDGFIER